MGIYRRGRIYHIDFSDQNRGRIQESSHSTNKRDAEKLLALRKSEVLRGIYHQPVRMTVGEFVVPYMEHAKANKRSWLRDEQMLKPLVGFLGADRQLTDNRRLTIRPYPRPSEIASALQQRLWTHRIRLRPGPRGGCG
jgi:hypothetical protein